MVLARPGAAPVQANTRTGIRKILASEKFLSAILGPEMAAPILWAPRSSAFFLQENSMSIKFLGLGGGGIFFFFYGRGDFSDGNVFLENARLSGTGDSQRDSRESIRANHSQLKPLFL